MDIAGKLDLAALEAGLEDVVARHENLRATFPRGSQDLRMEPKKSLSGYFRFFDVGKELQPSQRRAGATDLLLGKLQEPFDLEHGPLFRACLVRVDEECHVLGLSVDHIIADAKSRDVLVRDLTSLYETHAAGTDPALPEVTVQFADYAAWEREYLQGDVLERLVAYWRGTLSGVDPIPASDLADPGAPGGAPGAARLRLTTSAELKARLTAVADARRVSMYMILSAAVKSAMGARRRPAGDGHPYDVAVFGSAANRMMPEVSDVFGYFATPIVFRTDLSGDPTLEEVLARESRAVLGALRRQQLPHSLVTKAVNPAQYGVRHGGDDFRIPRYVNFDFGSHLAAATDDTENPHRATARFRQVGLPALSIPRGGLRILAAEDPNAISVDVRYRTDHYSAEWVSAFTGDIERFLNAVADDCRMRLSGAVPAEGSAG